MRRLSALIGATLTLIVTGCSDVSVVENEHSGTFGSEEYAHDASRGDIPVTVAGSAFGLDRRSLTDIVVRDMQGADWSPHARFTALSGPNAAKIYSYAMMFNGPGEATGAALCAQPQAMSSIPPMPSKATTAPGTVVLVAALCRYNVATMGVTARVANVSGPDDPKFRSLVRTTVFELTRPNQRRIGRNSDSGSSSNSSNSNR
jgi:hypothetical protein